MSNTPSDRAHPRQPTTHPHKLTTADWVTRDNANWVLQFIPQYIHTPPFNPSLHSPNLINPIHPLLSRSKFTSLTDAMYTTLTPSLRLISRWLTDPRVLAFHYHDIVGGYSLHKGQLYRSQTAVQDLTNPVNKRFVSSLFRQKLQNLAKGLKWVFLDSEAGGLGEAWCLGFPGRVEAFQAHGKTRYKDLHAYEEEYKSTGLSDRDFEAAGGKTKKPRGEPLVYPVIYIHHSNRAELERISLRQADPWDPNTPESDLNFLLFLAVTMAHELVHALRHIAQPWQVQSAERANPADVWYSIEEVEDTRYVDPEAGYSWEWYMFGHLVHPGAPGWAGEARFPVKALCFSHVQEYYVDEGRRKEHVFVWDWPVTVEWVARWFREEHWGLGRKSEEIRGLPVVPFRILTKRKREAVENPERLYRRKERRKDRQQNEGQDAQTREDDQADAEAGQGEEGEEDEYEGYIDGRLFYDVFVSEDWYQNRLPRNWRPTAKNRRGEGACDDSLYPLGYQVRKPIRRKAKNQSERQASGQPKDTGGKGEIVSFRPQ